MTEFEAFLDGFNYLTIEIKIDIYNTYAVSQRKERIYLNNNIELEKLFDQYSHVEMLQVYKYSDINEKDKWIMRKGYYKWDTLKERDVRRTIECSLKDIFNCRSSWKTYLDQETIKTKARNINKKDVELDNDMNEIAIARACFEEDYKDSL